jgi:hypothetical protein
MYGTNWIVQPILFYLFIFRKEDGAASFNARCFVNYLFSAILLFNRVIYSLDTKLRLIK